MYARVEQASTVKRRKPLSQQKQDSKNNVRDVGKAIYFPSYKTVKMKQDLLAVKGMPTCLRYVMFWHDVLESKPPLSYLRMIPISVAIPS